MASFTNVATLSYNGNLISSNTVTGELQEALSASKTATLDTYTPGSNITYIVSLVNSGSTSFSGLTLTDNLGAYDFNGTTLYPLAYAEDSLKYFINGVLQASPAVTPGAPLSISGLNVPAGGTLMLVYEATVTSFAPGSADASIVNEATVSGEGLSTPLTVTETVFPADGASLSITKALSPAVISESQPLTYTFTIQNTGNTEAGADANIVLTDTFNPVLNNISVTLNGVALATPADYTYNPNTGLFTTTAGRITVPAATFTQSADGSWVVTPGISTLVVTGTV